MATYLVIAVNKQIVQKISIFLITLGCFATVGGTICTLLGFIVYKHEENVQVLTLKVCGTCTLAIGIVLYIIGSILNWKSQPKTNSETPRTAPNEWVNGQPLNYDMNETSTHFSGYLYRIKTESGARPNPFNRLQEGYCSTISSEFYPKLHQSHNCYPRYDDNFPSLRLPPPSLESTVENEEFTKY